MAQTSGLNPKNKVKVCFEMFDVADWVSRLNGEDGPKGSPSHETLSVASQGALENSSVTGHPPSLVRVHFSSSKMVAKPCQRTEGLIPSFQIPQYPNLYRHLKRRLDAHLEQDSVKGLWSESFPGPKMVQGPVSESDHVGNDRQLNSVFLALKWFKDRCQNQTMLVTTDNSTVIAYINKEQPTQWKYVLSCGEFSLQKMICLCKKSANYLCPYQPNVCAFELYLFNL